MKDGIKFFLEEKFKEVNWFRPVLDSVQFMDLYELDRCSLEEDFSM